ncbi:MraY family glycosyltransferase [Neobacillus sp. NPDC093182]|uniref:MraY family glycosyltransferase n=1 Tax=Neobacillus sp. NPDC093182 TaxID=3364297 RepID=UPI0037F8CA41
MLYISLIICFVVSILLSLIAKRSAMTIEETDKPENKFHKTVIPSLGGLAIIISFIAGISIVSPNFTYTIPIIIGATIIAITGVLAERFQLTVKWKFIGQTIAALVVIVWGGVQVSSIYTLQGGYIEFGYLTIPLTLVWIIGITNGINLSPSLDGLAKGVSTIALITMTLMAYITGDSFVANTGGLLIASTLGFLLVSSYSPKILIGDKTSFFLGFMIAVLSISGFNNVMMIYIPAYILGVPIVLHYYLLGKGFTFKQTVSICCSIAAIFSLGAFIFSTSIMWGAIIILTVIFVSSQFLSKYRFI